MSGNAYLVKIADTVLKFSQLLELILEKVKENNVAYGDKLSADLITQINQSAYITSGNDKIPEGTLQVTVISLINNFTKRVALEFQLSVLAGEHYFNSQIDTIDAAIEKLKEALNKLNLTNQKFGRLLVGRIEINHLEKDLLDFVSLYKRLIRFVTLDLDFSARIEPIFANHEDVVSQEEIQKITDQLPSQNIARPFLKYFSLFQINVKVASIDDNFGCGVNILYELIKIKNYLTNESLKADRIAEILSDKCKFLIKKVYYSLHERGQRLVNDSDPSGTKISSYLIEEFASFEKSTLIHYDEFNKSVDPQLIYTFENKVKNNSSNDRLLFREIYLLSKYYQFKCASIENVETKIGNLINYFEETYGSYLIFSNFDKQAYRTTLIFLKNKKLWILSHLALSELKKVQNTITKENIKQKLDDALSSFNKYFAEIRDEQVTEILNYFSFYVFCYCYTEVLKFLKDLSTRIEIGFPLIEDYIMRFRTQYRIAVKNLEWCKDKNFMLLYMPYQECISEVIFDKKSQTKTYLFLDSSFVLPVDYDEKTRQLTTCLEDFTDTRVLLVNNLLGQKAIEVEKLSSDIKSKTTEIDNKLEDQNIKLQKQYNDHVQLLAVFAAIIAFVFGSISVIPKFSDTRSIVVFMLAFSAAMSGFVITIRLLVREELKKMYILIIILVIFILVSIGLLKKWNTPLKNEDSKTEINNTVSPVNSQSQQIIDSCCPPARPKKPCPKCPEDSLKNKKASIN